MFRPVDRRCEHAARNATHACRIKSRRICLGVTGALSRLSPGSPATQTWRTEMKNTRLRFAAVVAAIVAFPAALAWAAGLWSTLPGIGAASFCGSTVTGITLPAAQGPYAVVPGSTQGTGASSCGQTIPAGPAVFTGNEYSPYDTGTSVSPATAVVGIIQLGQGPMIDLTTVGTAQTIPNNTPWFFLDGGPAP